MHGAAHDIEFERVREPGTGTSVRISPRAMESLWVRLKAGDRLRPRDAQLLKRLNVRPFDGCGVYELDACGYVVAVGLPGASQRLDARCLLAEFEAVYGIPRTFSGPLGGGHRACGT